MRVPLPKYINMNRAGIRESFQLEMFTKFGIVAYRLQKDGQLAWIKHATYGWMSPRRYLLIQRVENLPWDKIVEGGYRINEALFNNPTIGIPIVLGATGALIYALAIQDFRTAALLAAALTLPFGAILLAYMFLDAAGKAARNAIDQDLDALEFYYEVAKTFGSQGIVAGLGKLIEPGLPATG